MELWRRVAVRTLVVVSTLLLVASWRLDQGVRTAYDSGWTSGPGSKDRLPQTLLEAYPHLSVLAFVCLLAATELWRRWRARHPSGAASDAGTVALTAIALVTLLAAAGDVMRSLAVRGWHRYVLTLPKLTDLGALATVGLLVYAISRLTPEAGGVPGIRLRRFIQLHRMNLAAVALLTLALTVVAQTSGQAIDSIRVWTDGTPRGCARLVFGIATSLLLALVVLEGGIDLARKREPRTGKDGETPVFLGARWLFASSGALVVCALVLRFWLGAGEPLLVVAGAFLFLGLLELPKKLEGKPLPDLPASEQRSSEYLAIVPLLAVAATSVAAAIDASLSGGLSFDAVRVVFPGLGLAALAVLMTAPGAIVAPGNPRSAGRIAGASVPIALAAGIVVVAFSVRHDIAAWVAVAVGGSLAALAVAYAYVVFHTAVGASLFLSRPVALAAGFAVFFGVHGGVARVSETLGVFSLLNVSLAFILTWVNFAVAWGLVRRPPRFLWWARMEQAPILTLILLVWIVAGLFGPAELHDARVDTRTTVAGAPTGPQELPALFRTWVAAQPELAGTGPGPPVPLVVVASHGGGIRATYWTDLVLDCVVAVRPRDQPDSAVTPADPQTCDDARRRTQQEQQVAARRIFLASGVSGGAVGLYAYARQLLEQASPDQPARAQPGLGQTRSWVGSRLGTDFASPTIAWALFHDLPNHLIGLHSHRGGACRAHLFGQCQTEDRAAALENTFDSRWDDELLARLRYVWDLRFSSSLRLRSAAGTVPLLVTNATVSGGSTRAVVSAGDLAAWPRLESSSTLRPSGGVDPTPLAGTVEIRDTLCESHDMLLVSAAFLGARFPFVSPSGHIFGSCAVKRAQQLPADLREKSGCARLPEPDCAIDVVDGGYVDNSGLFTIEVLWPSLGRLVADWNKGHARKIAMVLLEIDNHYRAAPREVPRSKGQSSQTLIPLNTLLGGRGALETYARQDAYRLTADPSCTVTIFPHAHPGLTAPLGWELSVQAQDDLVHALTAAPPGVDPSTKDGRLQATEPVRALRQLQQWLGGDHVAGLGESLSSCLP